MTRRWPRGAIVRMSLGIGFLTLALAAGVLKPGEPRTIVVAPTPVELIAERER